MLLLDDNNSYIYVWFTEEDYEDIRTRFLLRRAQNIFIIMPYFDEKFMKNLNPLRDLIWEMYALDPYGLGVQLYLITRDKSFPLSLGALMGIPPHVMKRVNKGSIDFGYPNEYFSDRYYVYSHIKKEKVEGTDTEITYLYLDVSDNSDTTRITFKHGEITKEKVIE